MRKILFCLPIVFIFVSAVFAEQVVVEGEVRSLRPPTEQAVKKLRLDTYYEYSWIKQGGRHILWKTGFANVSFNAGKGVTPYVSLTSYNRNHVADETVELGTYAGWAGGVAHAALGYGTADPDFVYKFQAQIGYEHRLVKNLSWKFDYRFLDYRTNDVNILIPGLIYYFGNSYWIFEYGLSETENRGLAQWGTLKANLYINEFLDFSIGSAAGERLFDIFDTLKAGQQYGYLFFAGPRFKIGPDASLRIGYSYAVEKPSFFKRGVDLTFSVKF
ncbi:MAG TPA: YaiO family outer membrane beta-barrel protein [Candidatus Omnitrophota bacterium]|nr:YaiO family outer membrane beta-barrel protein [Candidatus Omnitrophota bacterium]